MLKMYLRENRFSSHIRKHSFHVKERKREIEKERESEVNDVFWIYAVQIVFEQSVFKSLMYLSLWGL